MTRLEKEWGQIMEDLKKLGRRVCILKSSVILLEGNKGNIFPSPRISDRKDATFFSVLKKNMILFIFIISYFF